VVFIPIPPLRDRKEDIVILARHFLAKHSRVLNRNVTDMSSDVMTLFQEYDWPGNVRELEHVIEGAINLVVSSPTIERRHLQSHLTTWHRLRGQTDTVQPPRAGSLFGGSDISRRSGGRPTSRSPSGGRRPFDNERSLLTSQADHEKKVIAAALAGHAGNVTRAAESIGISRQLFTYKMKKYRLSRQDYLV
jgi:arginine utilization regulatory protein